MLEVSLLVVHSNNSAPAVLLLPLRMPAPTKSRDRPLPPPPLLLQPLRQALLVPVGRS
jgi:hypothetical protein